MDRKAVSERLRALASDDKKRSKAARLREVMDDVEAALAAGVTRADVLDALKAHGLEMSLATFETTLKRIRAKYRRSPARPTVSNPPSQVVASKEVLPAAPTPPPEPSAAGAHSHSPADLDQIIGSKPDLNALAKHAKRRKS